MTVRCPCGCGIDGKDDGERSRNFRDHLVREHEQEADSLHMLEVREELGEDVTKALISMELEMRAHLLPTAKSQEEILKDSVQGCGATCVSEFSLSRQQLEDYAETITCPVCGRKVGGDNDGELTEALCEHCNGHEKLRATMQMRVLPGPR